MDNGPKSKMAADGKPRGFGVFSEKDALEAEESVAKLIGTSFFILFCIN